MQVEPPINALKEFQPFFENGGFYMRDDGKIGVRYHTMWDTPWVHIRIAGNRKCNFWNRIFAPKFGMVHSGCQECWKVVVGPRTLSELFDLYECMKKMDLPSKCGIEIRQYVHRLYGGYYYNDSLEQGRECYEFVRKEIPEEIPIILKRGCTELELSFGKSDNWKIKPGQIELERYLDDILIHEISHSPQPEWLIRGTMEKWIKFAYAYGDDTYKEFADGPLYPGPVTYHNKE